MIKKYLKNQGGYTIIETMIAISLFIIIVMIGTGALLNANLLHQKSRDMRSIIDNLSFIMEDMSKNLRTGYNYHCLVAGEDTLPTPNMSNPKSCSSGGWGVAFESALGSYDNNDDQWVYYIDSGKIFKSINGPSNLSNFIQLTPEEVEIDATSSFLVTGAEAPDPDGTGDHEQPFITIKLIGKITYKNVVSPFSLQTSVSQRQIDI